MGEFQGYILGSIQPVSVFGFLRSLPHMLSSAYLPFWIMTVFPIMRYVLPELGCWLVYWVWPTRIRPALHEHKQRAEPLVSVVIAGRNESGSIEAAIRAAVGCGYRHLEVIFVDDDSDDDTVAVARRTAQSLGLHRSDKIRIFEAPRRGGKSSALNIGLSVARGKFVAVIDADSTIQFGAMQHWLRPFEDPAVGAVAGNLRVRNSEASFLAQMQELEYALQVTLARLAEAQLGLLNIIPGAAGLFRTEILRRLGGYDSGLGDDTDMTVKLRKQRWKLAFSLDAVVWTDVPETRARLFRQRARWERNMVKIRLSKHRDMFLLGRYGLSNAIVTLDLLVMRLLLPWVALVGITYFTCNEGPLAVPTLLTDLYWWSLPWIFLRGLMARDLSCNPVPERFWLIFVYPFYKIILRFVVMAAQAKELLRIGIKHPYVPDHVWAQTPWW
jgi:cellulose synthase/poly-beta-1,6-N-acetylglucosamine synthase-like glycosyltransferase